MGSLAEDLLVLAVMAENAGVQSARRMPYVRDPESAPDDAWALAALAHAAGLAAYLYPGTGNQEKRQRLDEIARECQSAGPVLEAVAGEQQQAMRAAMGPVMRSALSWGNDLDKLVALNSLTHTTGPDVSHHSPGGHGHGGGHHG